MIPSVIRGYTAARRNILTIRETASIGLDSSVGRELEQYINIEVVGSSPTPKFFFVQTQAIKKKVNFPWDYQMTNILKIFINNNWFPNNSLECKDQ